MRQLYTGAALAMMGAVLLAGCGGSKSASNGTSTTETVTTGSTSSGASGGNASGSGGSKSGSAAAGGGESHPLTPKQKVEVCQRIVQAPSQLTAAQKSKLLKNCEKAGSNTTAAQQEIIHEVCAIYAARLPAGAVRERALAACPGKH